MFLENVSLSEYTSFRTGGPADKLAVCTNEEELTSAIGRLRSEEIPFIILGNGSNVLVSDKGIRGAVIVIKSRENDVEVSEDGMVSAFSGCSLSRLAMAAAKASLTGLEFASGIPGTLGGGVVMNAGAYGSELKDVIVSARVLTEDGKVLTLSKDELDLSYRHSCIPANGYIVLSACFRLEKGEPDAITGKMKELNARRREKQPLEYPSAGSTFKRPEGYFAGKLIEDAGLKGFTVGGACVSQKHCGFVINKGDATSADIFRLITEVKRRVMECFGVELEPEVKIIGDFSDVIL